MESTRGCEQIRLEYLWHHASFRIKMRPYLVGRRLTSWQKLCSKAVLKPPPSTFIQYETLLALT